MTSGQRKRHYEELGEYYGVLFRDWMITIFYLLGIAAFCKYLFM